MLEIVILPKNEFYNEKTESFEGLSESVTLQLEHSLVSLKNWEAKWHKPFLGKEEKTTEEILDYIRCMTITKNVDPVVYYFIEPKQLQEIFEYIENPMTATWFGSSGNDSQKAPIRKKVITAEVIYYWMVTLNIPVEFQEWHLNQLLTLIRVINAENDHPNKKMSKRDLLARNSKLNAARRAKNRSRG